MSADGSAAPGTPGAPVPPGERASASPPPGATSPPGADARRATLVAEMRAAGLPVGPDAPLRWPPAGPRRRRLAARAADALRRAVDALAAAGALLLLALPLGLVLLAVRLESPGSPLFRQRRVGRDGRPFDVLKVRTMVSGAEGMGAGLAIVAGDARITRLGGLLRRTSIDELPQLVCVLRGDMALVGPRPTVPSQVERYDDRQRERLLVRPGLTGLAQVLGRTTLGWPERIEIDRHYVAHRTLRHDLRILRATVRVVLGGAGVERSGAAWRD